MMRERTIDERLRTALDTIPQAFWLARVVRDDAGGLADLVFLYQSAGASRLTGRSSAEIVGRRSLDLWPALRATRVWEGYRRLVETGQPVREQTTAADPAIEGWFDTTALLIDRDCVAVYAENITSRRRAEEALRILAEAGTTLNASLDPQETIRNVARALVPGIADMCGVDLLEGGRLQRVAFAGGSDDMARSHWATGPVPMDGTTGMTRVLRTGEPELVPIVTDAWLDQLTRSPEREQHVRAQKPRSVLIVPVRNGALVIGGLWVAITQVSRRAYDEADIALLQAIAERASAALAKARLYEGALQARRLRDDTLALVSHDFRSGLNTILMNATSLARHGNAPELDRIRRVVAQADSLISDLTTTARLESGQLPLDRALQPMSPLVHEVLDLQRMSAEEKGVTLREETSDDVPPAHFDARRILQVLTNLVRNALAFTGEGGHVSVRTSREGEELHVAVSDDGAGISPEDQAHLFDRFWQAVHSRRAGAGLGLAIAKGIVEQHGGTLRVASELGKGATFTFSLPLTLETETLAAAPRNDAVSAPHDAEARTFAESVIDTVRESLLVLDGGLRVRSANRAFHETFGLSPDETEGKVVFQLGGGDWDLPALRAYLEEQRVDAHSRELRLEHAFQRVGWRALLLNARRIEGSQLVLLAMQDVTESARAQKALETRDLELHAILMSAAEAIVMVDDKGKLVFANRKASVLFGFTEEEMLGLPVDTLVPERLRALHALLRANYAAAPTGTDVHRELVGRRKDGTEVPLEISLSPLVREGRPPVVLAFVTDLTRKREADAKIHDYQTKLQRMTFDASVVQERERRRIAVELHDRIGQSLAVAKMKLASVAAESSGANAAAVEYAMTLLEQSANDTRSLMFELSPPVLYDLGLAAGLSWLAEDIEKRLQLRVDLLDDGECEGLDETTAAVAFRAVRELLTNVVKHAKVAEATVSLRRVADCVRITVADAGVGFDAKDEALWSTGGGFGLFSVREQITRLGGTVDLASVPGAGTRVTLQVPVNRPR
jgi:PAS domain S-box-containing protein